MLRFMLPEIIGALKAGGPIRIFQLSVKDSD